MSFFRENIDNIQGYEPGFQPPGAGVIKLNTNENPYEPSPRMLEAIRDIDPEQIRRYPQPFGDDFRAVIGPRCCMTSPSITVKRVCGSQKVADLPTIA